MSEATRTAPAAEPTQPAGPQPVAVHDPKQIFSQVPFMAWLQMRREFSEGGRARLSIDAREELGNVIGAVHGGVVVTLLDVAMASAAVSHRNFECTAVTLNLNTSFLGPGRGRLSCDGELLACDAQIATCRAVVTDAEGRVVARAQGSFRYLPLPKSSQPPQPLTPG
ncbi:PaaI family thioesterase [Curvibacter sp. HBC28]|uniref:PaaI family thioesterase n=1 Tax=Curvibacter microcysteis TaxID=3026419 RepID=A0ABT5MFW7_9BURK|nr:PaaI family thioesterase [Curvibacter sp. HBC28]MDD0814065.1 PaaI family thioesterase [Curvibacter sp. HBC28]